MAAASIRISQAGVTGAPSVSRDDLVLDVPVLLTNADNSGVRSWRWRLKDRPSGSAAVLSNPVAAQCTFTPDVPGSYLVELAVDGGRAGEIDTRVAAVRETVLGESLRMPAAGEDAAANWDGNTRGWLPDVELWLRTLAGASGDVSDLPLSALADGPANSVIVRAANTPGPYAALAASANRQVLIRDAGSLVWRELDLQADFPEFATVHETDFGDVTPTTIVDGTNTIAGVPWLGANTSSASIFRIGNVSDVGDDGGLGLRIQHAASSTTTISPGTTVNAPRVGAYLTDLDPDYSEQAEYLAMIHVTRMTSSASEPAAWWVGCGLYGALSDPQTSKAERYHGAVLRRSTGTVRYRPGASRAGSTAFLSDLAYEDGTCDVIAIRFGPYLHNQCFAGVYDSGWPDPGDMVTTALVGENTNSIISNNYNDRGIRLTLSLATMSSNTGQPDAMVRRVRLLRKVR